MNRTLISFLLLVAVFAVAEAGIFFCQSAGLVKETKKSVENLNKTTAEVYKASVTANNYFTTQVTNLQKQQKALDAAIQLPGVYNAAGRVINKITLPKINRAIENLDTRSGQLLESLNTTVQSTNSLIQHTDKNVNDLIPQITETAKAMNVSVQSLDKAIQEITSKSSVTLDDIHNIMASKEWLEVLQHIDGIAGDIDKTTDQMPSIAASIEKMAKVSSKYQKAVILAQIFSAIARAF